MMMKKTTRTKSSQRNDPRKPAGFLILAVLLLPYYTALAGSNYKPMAREFTRAAYKHKVYKVAVLPFSSIDNPGSREERTIAEQLTTELVRLGKVDVVERELLEKVMQEHRLTASGVIYKEKAKKFGEILPVDAILTGSLSKANDKLKVYARMIEVETGKVLHAVDEQFKTEWSVWEDWNLSKEMPKLEEHMVQFEVEVPALPDDNTWNSAYNQAEATINQLYRSILDIKARYWSAKLKEPGFSIASLTRNPGSDIPDRGLRTRFYELLKAWYYRGNTSRLTLSELKTLARVEDKIRQITAKRS